jgi:hypothetical protein
VNTSDLRVVFLEGKSGVASAYPSWRWQANAGALTSSPTLNQCEEYSHASFRYERGVKCGAASVLPRRQAL